MHGYVMSSGDPLGLSKRPIDFSKISGRVVPAFTNALSDVRICSSMFHDLLKRYWKWCQSPEWCYRFVMFFRIVLTITSELLGHAPLCACRYRNMFTHKHTHTHTHTGLTTVLRYDTKCVYSNWSSSLPAALGGGVVQTH